VADGLSLADSGAGVAVLPDLGSAVLTVRAVLEDLVGNRVLLADAPFVEGAVAATVTAAGGDVKAVAAALIAILSEATKVGGLPPAGAGRAADRPRSRIPRTVQTCNCTSTTAR
jgi:hypothetical protein